MKLREAKDSLETVLQKTTTVKAFHIHRQNALREVHDTIKLR